MTPFAAALLLACALAGAAEGEREAVERRLETLRAELKTLFQERERLVQEEGAVLAALAEADRTVAASLTRERELAAALAANEARLAAAAADLAAHRQALAAEAARLAAIARLAFLLGRDAARVSLLLPERAGGRARALASLAYLKGERGRALARVRALAAAATGLVARAEAEGQALAAGREALRAERARLEEARREQSERAQTLRGLRQSAEARASALEREAATLEALLERLADVFADLPQFMAGRSLSERRGALRWPIAGEVVERFGSGDELGRPRRGLGISAPEGSPVHAVAHGRVAFADWMPGLGMLLVLDHGEGFFSLYGHLGALLVESGEWVEEGQAIALLGRSGGIDAPKLHFELRRHGRALDPLSWLARTARRR